MSAILYIIGDLMRSVNAALFITRLRISVVLYLTRQIVAAFWWCLHTMYDAGQGYANFYYNKVVNYKS